MRVASIAIAAASAAAAVLIAAAASVPRAAAGAEIEAGAAAVDITPPVGYRMCGYFSERLSSGVHDPLQAKALYLRQGETAAALVFCDLIGLDAAVSRRARALAAESCGLPAAHIAIAATHSHTGPLYAGALRKHFHDVALQKHGKDPQEAVDYPAQLAERIAGAVAKAKAAARPSRLASGIAEQKGLSFNRRFHMKDGSVVFNPGKLNPNIVKAAGPVDHELGLLILRDAAGGEPYAGLSVFALHLDTVGGTEYSGDYPFHLENALRAKLGGGFLSLFGAGTCGDLNHIDVSHDRPQKGQEESRRIGEALARTALAALPALRALDAPALAVASTDVRVELQRYSEAEIAQAKKDIEKVGTSQLPFLEQVKAYKILDLVLRGGSHADFEVQAFRFDEDTALVTLPGEVFVDLGLAVKRGSPFKTTMVVELANDDPDYVPTRKAFAEGSYETVNSRIAPGGGEALVEAALTLLKGLAPR
jgi:hypothetical protein